MERRAEFKKTLDSTDTMLAEIRLLRIKEDESKVAEHIRCQICLQIAADAWVSNIC